MFSKQLAFVHLNFYKYKKSILSGTDSHELDTGKELRQKQQLFSL